jgi:DNA polymerase I-like protein with 3'-5' exonuclease and polymerase domains
MKVTVQQVLDLQVEIAGVKTEKFTVIGLLNEKLNIKTKYRLQKLFKKIKAETEEYSEVERTLFNSLGAVEENGLLIIKDILEDGSINPARLELEEERKKLLEEVVDLGDFEFNIEEFDFESESNYYTFMSVAFDL